MLAIEDDDIIVDAARSSGVSEGEVLEIFRPLVLRHPVTRRTIVDRYRIGELKLTQVRERIALGRAAGSLLRKPAVGDVVVRAVTPLSLEPSPGKPPDAAAVPARSGGASADASATELNALFDSLRGATLAARVLAYERHAAAHPGSRYSRTLLEEAAALRELIAARKAPRGSSGGEGAAPENDLPKALHFVPPDATVDHAPLSVGIELVGAAVGAVLSSRNSGEVAFRAQPMEAAGDGYYVTVIPGDRVLGPEIQYFIEATRPTGEAVPVAGSPGAPMRTRVDRVPQVAPPLAHRSSINVVTDYADYNRLRGNDRVFQTEGTFGMRFHEVGVRALRTGFGVYRGVGGSIDALDRLDLPPRNVGFTYGHVEAEFGLRPALSVVTRAVVGLGDDGTSGGGQLHLRIGSDLSTNLAFGGEVLGGVGLRGITELQLQPLGRFPVLIRSEVTNQPAGVAPSRYTRADPLGTTDIGIRAIVQVGFRPVDSLVLALRGSYQGRTIDHSGPGFGAAVEYRW